MSNSPQKGFTPYKCANATYLLSGLVLVDLIDVGMRVSYRRSSELWRDILWCFLFNSDWNYLREFSWNFTSPLCGSDGIRCCFSWRNILLGVAFDAIVGINKQLRDSSPKNVNVPNICLLFLNCFKRRCFEESS